MKSSLEVYLLTHGDALEADKLTENDWQQLKEVVVALEPFWLVSMRLQGQGNAGSHGVIWEALPALDFLMEYCETKKNELAVNNPLQLAYQNAWEKLCKYNDLTDEAHEIYAAAALLNPCLRKRYFIDRWTDDAAAFITPIIAKNKSIWEKNYRQIQPDEPSQEFRSLFDAFIAGVQHHSAVTDEDEFDKYIEAPQKKAVKWKDENLFQWWMDYPCPSLRQWAFDTLSIPAMSTEIERVFASSKRTITADRNSLSNESFEAIQCMKHWLDNKLVE